MFCNNAYKPGKNIIFMQAWTKISIEEALKEYGDFFSIREGSRGFPRGISPRQIRGVGYYLYKFEPPYANQDEEWDGVCTILILERNATLQMPHMISYDAGTGRLYKLTRKELEKKKWPWSKTKGADLRKLNPRHHRELIDLLIEVAGKKSRKEIGRDESELGLQN